jgi:hypothetical protein
MALATSESASAQPRAIERGVDWSRHPLWDIRFDADTGVIRVSCHGLWMPADADHHIDELQRIVEHVRPLGPARVMADLRDTVVRPMDTAQRLRERNRALYRDGERLALVVGSSLLKMQTRRNLLGSWQEIFLSENAAETWLRAHD